MKKFLDDLRLELNKRNMNPDDIDEIIADHEEMIKTALAEGLNEQDIVSRFGNPAKLAEELDDEPKVSRVAGQDPEGYRLWKSLPVTEKVILCDFHLISEDVTLQTTPQKEIRILYATDQRHPDECKNIEKALLEYQFSFQNGLLTVKAPKSNGFLFSRNHSCDVTLLIEIPDQAVISDFGFATVSGDVTLLNLKAETFGLSTTSGDATIKSLQAESARLNTVSGDIHLSGACLKSLDSNQVSGDMILEDVHIENDLKTHTVSGDTKIMDSDCGECALDSVSGDIQGTEFYPKRVSLRSLSGDIYLTNKEPGRIQILSQKTMSGEIHIR